MDFSPGYKCIQKYRGAIQRYMMESKDVISGFASVNLKLGIEIGNLVSFNGQSVSFRLSIR